MTPLDWKAVEVIRRRHNDAVQAERDQTEPARWSDVSVLLRHLDAVREEYAMWRESVTTQGQNDAALIAAQERRITKLKADEGRLDLLLDRANGLLRGDVRTRKELDACLLTKSTQQVA